MADDLEIDVDSIQRRMDGAANALRIVHCATCLPSVAPAVVA